MKRIIFLLALLMAFTATQAQVYLPKGVIVGTGGNQATLSAAEMKNLDGTTSNIQTQLDAKAAATNVYTKSQADAITNLKANTSDVYTKAQTDALVAPKANSTDVYTKAESDAITDTKADKSTTYTKTEVDNIADMKLSISDSVALDDFVYLKPEVDAALTLKANTSTTYTKTEVDNAITTAMNASVYMNPLMKQMLEENVPVKAIPMFSIGLLGSTYDLTDGRLQFVAFRIYETTTMTGVKYTLGQAGDYVGDGYNGVVLYSVSGTTLTEVTRTANNADFWKGSVNTIRSADFPAPVSLSPGYYYVAHIYNQTGTAVTAPKLALFGTIANTGSWMPSTLKVVGYTTGVADPASSYTFSSLTNFTQLWGIWLY